MLLDTTNQVASVRQEMTNQLAEKDQEIAALQQSVRTLNGSLQTVTETLRTLSSTFNDRVAFIATPIANTTAAAVATPIATRLASQWAHNYAFDAVVDSWCASRGSWRRNTHAVLSQPFHSRRMNCHQICAESDNAVSTTWSCLAGNTRIAPDWPSSGSHSAHASFYWGQACGSRAVGNGRTYCCCVG